MTNTTQTKRLMDLRSDECEPGTTLEWHNERGESGTITFGERMPSPVPEFAIKRPDATA